MAVFIVSECKIGVGVLGGWQNSHTDFLAYGVKAVIVEKVKEDYCFLSWEQWQNIHTVYN